MSRFARKLLALTPKKKASLTVDRRKKSDHRHEACFDGGETTPALCPCVRGCSTEVSVSRITNWSGRPLERQGKFTWPGLSRPVRAFLLCSVAWSFWSSPLNILEEPNEWPRSASSADPEWGAGNGRDPWT